MAAPEPCAGGRSLERERGKGPHTLDAQQNIGRFWGVSVMRPSLVGLALKRPSRIQEKIVEGR